eukprot:CAMPEP_0196821108 /NCGR_PEP_ID=MMETSP1362-20130617/77844_1 /TAXON_ID=163516 /ORGANISM="Leptocylindrus danicus, Strain CCMP1856" /LENGTH=260 /DNA_ID=CAMNT_0042200183 /DNA_START=88 /DNA_END=870 /DNA_ORIENTATION=-
MGEARDSPQRRKQYLVICTIMAAMFFGACIASGVFQPVYITEGTYPGGEFIYLSEVRDYSAHMALFRKVAGDLYFKPKTEWGDLLFGIYMDEERNVPGGKMRYSVGTLLDKDEGLSVKPLLERFDGHATHAYEKANLPSVRAGMVHFPFTNGFVSCLTHQYKILPAMQKYAKQHGVEGTIPIMTSTCSIKEKMCTHYIPLEKSEMFLLGKTPPEEYSSDLYSDIAQQNAKSALNTGKILKGLKKLFSGKTKVSRESPSEL